MPDLGSAPGNNVLRCWCGMNPEDMQSILAAYGMCTDSDYRILESVGGDQATAEVGILTLATSHAGDVWASVHHLLP